MVLCAIFDCSYGSKNEKKIHVIFPNFLVLFAMLKKTMDALVTSSFLIIKIYEGCCKSECLKCIETGFYPLPDCHNAMNRSFRLGKPDGALHPWPKKIFYRSNSNYFGSMCFLGILHKSSLIVLKLMEWAGLVVITVMIGYNCYFT